MDKIDIPLAFGSCRHGKVLKLSMIVRLLNEVLLIFTFLFIFSTNKHMLPQGTQEKSEFYMSFGKLKFHCVRQKDCQKWLTMTASAYLLAVPTKTDQFYSMSRCCWIFISVRLETWCHDLVPKSPSKHNGKLCKSA